MSEKMGNSAPFALSRREVLVAGAALGTLSGALPGNRRLAAAEAERATTAKERVLRVAHATDVHLQPELRGPEGLAACFHHIQSHKETPDFILLGGDHIMNSFAQPRERVQLQWDTWSAVKKAECSLPMYSCLGNQDIFGWNKAASKTTGTEPEYGKQWAKDVLGLTSAYYSFDRNGWHFITLDGLQPGKIEGSLASYLDEEQMEWLRNDLASVPRATPILIWSHVPIISVLPILMAKRASLHDHALVAAGNCHTDANEILKLFGEYPNIKACFSGHLHRVEHISYRGIDFYTSGAVCGAWWKGPMDGFQEGYTLIDLYSDGSHAAQYVPYGWEAGVS